MGSNTVSVINGTTNVVVNNITLATGGHGEGAGGTGFYLLQELLTIHTMATYM